MNMQQLYDFHQADGGILFQPFRMHGVLKTFHFCSLCISSRDVIEALQKAYFCMTAMIPRTFSLDQSSLAFFFVTFAQHTCLNKLDEQICKMEGYKRDVQKFKFKEDGDEALTMVLSKEQPDSWVIGLQFINKVYYR